MGSTSSKTNVGNCTAEHFCAPLRGGSALVASSPRFSIRFEKATLCLQQEDLGERATASGCDGHNDCGAGCLCLRSVAYCDHPQPVLLSALLFARRTNCGLFLGGECGEQTRRHGSAEVKPKKTSKKPTKNNKHTQLHFLPLTL